MSSDASNYDLACLMIKSIEEGRKMADACNDLCEQVAKLVERVNSFDSKITDLETRIDQLNHQLIYDETVTCSCDKHDVKRPRTRKELNKLDS
jgi:hypothetical protein